MAQRPDARAGFQCVVYRSTDYDRLSREFKALPEQSVNFSTRHVTTGIYNRVLARLVLRHGWACALVTPHQRGLGDTAALEVIKSEILGVMRPVSSPSGGAGGGGRGDAGFGRRWGAG